MENEILNPVQVEIPPEVRNATTAAGQSAKSTLESAKQTHVLSQSAKPTPKSAESILPTLTALEALESAKSTSESAELTPAVSGASEVSSDDFATTVAALVGMEVPEVPDEEMVDYEPTLERVEVNVVVLSTDYYIMADDSMVAEFNFATESAIF